MFADELNANSSRKRAQEAKARRLKIKAAAQQQQPAVVAAAVATPGSAATIPGSSSSSTAASGIPVLTTTTTAITTSKLSALERAEEQRQVRAVAQRHQKASVQIQRLLRGYVTRTQLKRQWRDELHAYLQHRQEQERKKKLPTRDEVPPPSPKKKTSDMVHLYVRLKWWEQTVPVVELLLLPPPPPQDDRGGGNNDNNDPPIIIIAACADWDAKSRRSLLECLLEYYFHHFKEEGSGAANHNNNNNGYNIVAANLVTCLRGIVQQDRSLGIMVWRALRQSLTTIPPHAERMREQCFSSLEKIKNGYLTRWLLCPEEEKWINGGGGDKNDPQLFFLTCPLLSWRIQMTVDGWNTILPKLLVRLRVAIPWLDNNNDSNDDENGTEERCGSTAAQRVLADLLTLPFPRTVVWYDCVTTLLLQVPYETFASQSSVMWVEMKQQKQIPTAAAAAAASAVPPPKQKVAIVLNRVIVDQCKLLLVETHVRQILQPYEKYDERLLYQKNAQDDKEEQALVQHGSTAAALAAKDAKATTTSSSSALLLVGKWQSSAFAQRLSHGIGKLLVRQNSNKNQDGSGGGGATNNAAANPLPNTSDNAKRLAKGPESTAALSSSLSSSSPINTGSSLELFLAIVRTYAVIVSRWSGDGSINILRNSSSNSSSGKTTTTRPQPEQSVQSLLNVIGFSTKFLQMAWTLLQNDLADQVRAIHDNKKHGKDRSTTTTTTATTTTTTTPIRWRTVHTSDGGSVLYLFLSVFSHCLIVTDDAELHEMNRPIPLFQIRRCIQLLKNILYRAAVADDSSSASSSSSSTSSTSLDADPFGLALITASARTMRDLYDRSSRRPLCATKLWIVDTLLESQIGKCKSHADYNALLQTSPILRVCPYMVPFKRRLKLFERIVSTLRVEIQGENSANPFHNNPLKPGIQIRITRGRLLEDGLLTMNHLGTNLRGRLSVHYYNQAGTKEQGIDAGGLFKEFWTDLCSIAFDPNYALFRVTESSSGVGNCLYPNPSSGAAHGDTHTMLYAFLGRILGKALFEGITIRPIFSHFTLSFLRGDYNFLHMLADLSTIEPQLYNNLMFLKTYDGDASDLALAFTVTVEEFGGTREIPLLPNGADMEVTNANKHLYIGLVAKYYVYDRIRDQSEAMTKGLLEVIDRTWIQIFNEPELQVLISGASDGKLDVEDMRQHCQYAGGYSAIDPSILRFWSVVASMNEKHQSALLRFVTSCERPPPLGFRTLNPPFTIQRVGVFRDAERLPTASTCFNVLKLPTYSSEKVMRERLIYAIESGAGFELS
jgi:ubiquitin-protein ligase E3 C